MLRTLALLLLSVSVARGQEAAPLRLDAAEFARRRAALVERLGGAALALDAGPLGEVGSDANTYIFDFRYLTGIHDDQGIVAVVDGRSTVFVSAPRAVPGADEVKAVEEFPAWASTKLAGKKVHTKLRRRNLEAVSQAAGAEVVGGTLAEELTRLRLVKSEAELRLMRKAADATNRAHRAVQRALKPGLNEREIHDLILATFKAEGCPEIGFPPIVGSGRNGTVLHYMKNNQPIPADTLMVCDIGAAIDNYVTDITRTLPTSGKFTDEQKRHYQGVLDAQKAAEAVLKPGATFRDLDRAARAVLEERGLTKWSYAHSRDGSVRHGLGHYVGLAVHDSGTYYEKFTPGMVITIEPGWYDKDAGYGIRIEDVYLVTPDGFQRLSADAPREIAEIEAAMAAKRDY
ncbi:MAG TPA: M24 family metallopeptidase [Planctomycetota bacterium]|nr:M24 family metallopeptidase [Planctomycetota bacterium]